MKSECNPGFTHHVSRHQNVRSSKFICPPPEAAPGLHPLTKITLTGFLLVAGLALPGIWSTYLLLAAVVLPLALWAQVARELFSRAFSGAALRHLSLPGTGLLLAGRHRCLGSVRFHLRMVPPSSPLPAPGASCRGEQLPVVRPHHTSRHLDGLPGPARPAIQPGLHHRRHRPDCAEAFRRARRPSWKHSRRAA